MLPMVLTFPMTGGTGCTHSTNYFTGIPSNFIFRQRLFTLQTKTIFGYLQCFPSNTSDGMNCKITLLSIYPLKQSISRLFIVAKRNLGEIFEANRISFFFTNHNFPLASTMLQWRCIITYKNASQVGLHVKLVKNNRFYAVRHSPI